MNLAQNILFNFSLENIYFNNLILSIAFTLFGIVAFLLIVHFILLLDDSYKINKIGKLIFIVSFLVVGLSSHIASRSWSNSDALYSVDKGDVVYSVKFEKSHFECDLTNVFSCFHLQKHISRLEVFDRKTQKIIIIHECQKKSLYECMKIIDSKFEKLLNQPDNHFVLDDINKI